MPLFSSRGRFGAGIGNPQVRSPSARNAVSVIGRSPTMVPLDDTDYSWVEEYLKTPQYKINRPFHIPTLEERRRARQGREDDRGGQGALARFDSILDNIGQPEKENELLGFLTGDIKQRLSMLDKGGEKDRAEWLPYEEEEGTGRPTVDPQAALEAALPGLKARINEQVLQAVRSSGAVGAGKGSPLANISGKIAARETGDLTARHLAQLAQVSQAEADREERVKNARQNRLFGAWRDENQFNLDQVLGRDSRTQQLLQMLMSLSRGI